MFKKFPGGRLAINFAIRPLMIALIFCLPGAVRAQSDSATSLVTIPNTKDLKLYSTIADQEYRLFIDLPGNYARDTGKTYPVVYLLDGQYDFPTLTGIYGDQYYDGCIPEFIIVGIAWGGKDPNAGVLRGRDFTPTKIGQMSSGGGPKFLAFIKKELIPFIGSKFRVTEDRTLIGSSLGGLFTLYTLFNDPSLFHRYVLTSPALAWDKGVLRADEKKYEESGSVTPVRLFMGVGALESNAPEFQEFASRLKGKKVKGLELSTLVLEGTGHAGTKPEGYSRGLQYVFERPSLTLAPAKLDRYAGLYQIGTDTVRLIRQQGKLIASAPGNTQIVLEAESENDFYVKGVFLRVHFKSDEAGKVTGFQLEQFEGGLFVKKIG
jgi:predicted alpha/beta superfamily hydrolase